MIRDVNRHGLGISGVALALVLLPRVAITQPVTFDELANRLHLGEMVWVTDWSGKKTKGTVVELSPGSLALLVDGHWREWLAEDVKRVKRPTKSQPNAVTRHTLEAAVSCEEIDCLPAALMFVGVAWLAEGIDWLIHPPKTIYRADKRSSPRGHSIGFDAQPRPR